MDDATNSIRAVAERTGLSPHVIRVWEKRYRAVQPDRTATNRRLYTERDIERLSLLHAATTAGHSIGLIAGLPTDRLRQLLPNSPRTTLNNYSDAREAKKLQEECLASIQALDQFELERLLKSSAVLMGTQGMLRKLVAPLAVEVGKSWQAGELTAAHEHFASNVIRGFLSLQVKPFALASSAPTLLVATPSGQLHELGAVIVAAAATSHGWRVVYLGASLPPAEIAGAALRAEARAVAISLVYPEDDPNIPFELNQLRSALPPAIAILAGGRAARSYQAALAGIQADVANNLDELYPALDRLRGVSDDDQPNDVDVVRPSAPDEDGSTGGAIIHG